MTAFSCSPLTLSKSLAAIILVGNALAAETQVSNTPKANTSILPPESDSNGGHSDYPSMEYDQQVQEAEDLLHDTPQIPEVITQAPTPAPGPDYETPIQNLDSFLGAPESCTFCDTTDHFDPTLEFAGLSCDQWALLSFFAPPGDECTLLRAAAVKYCGCPTPVEETCHVCPHSPRSYNGDQNLMFLEGVTCQDVADLPAVDGEDTCEFVESFSYICGCPEVVPTCSLCGHDADTGAPLAMSRPDQVLVPGEEESHDLTCSDWDKLLSLDPRGNPLSMLSAGRSFKRENNKSSTTTTCEDSLNEFQDSTGLQLRGLCGCPDVEPWNLCSPCAEGYTLHDEEGDCQELTFLVPYVTSEEKCDYMHEAGVHFGCCVLVDVDSDSPTESATTKPIESETTNLPSTLAPEESEEEEQEIQETALPKEEDHAFPETEESLVFSEDEESLTSAEEEKLKDIHSSAVSLQASLLATAIATTAFLLVTLL